MTSETTHTRKATGKVLIFADLCAFVDRCKELGVRGDTPVDGRVRLAGLRQISVKVEQLTPGEHLARLSDRHRSNP